MTEWLYRIGPVGAVVVVFTWFCWPYITGSATTIESQRSGAIAVLSKDVLSPKVKNPSSRDPFNVIATLVESTSKAKKSTSTKATPAGDSPETAEADADAKAAAPLVLTGTYIQGDRSMAILGGAVYRAGQTVGPADAGNPPWTIKQILPDRVVLGRGGEIKVITYDDAASTDKAGATRGQKKRKGDSSPKDSLEASPDGLKPVTSLSELVRAVEGMQNQKP
jgi:hypothetical protein